MKNIRNRTGAARKRSGFTLVELLTVVLIIAVLAGLAVPRYNVAIERARVAEAMGIIGALNRAAQEGGSARDTATRYPNTFSGLDVNLPCTATGTTTNGDYCDLEHWRVFLTNGAARGVRGSQFNVFMHRDKLATPLATGETRYVVSSVNNAALNQKYLACTDGNSASRSYCKRFGYNVLAPGATNEDKGPFYIKK